ncbi:MAG: cobalamin biosynthesis protein [Bilophila wadsworthia]
MFDRHFAGTDQVIYTDSPEAVTARHAVLWDAEGTVPEEVQHLDITGKSFVLGVGCRRGVEPLELRLIAEGHLSDLGLRPGHIAAIASCDVKADEPAILELGEKWQVPVEFHAAARLDAVPVPTPSAKVREKVGTASVSEAACLLSAGYGSIPQPTLYAPKAAFGDVTLALARLPHLSAPKAAHGQVVVVGLGSGVPGQITPEVDAALRHCDTVAGYSNYVDFIRDRIIGKPIIQNGMMGEVARCRATLEAAAAGQEVCMVCSGDPGILAMAGLLFELRAREPEFADIPIRVLPGITAANIAAASLGAPLQNGFSLVSLSDLLVPSDRSAAKSPGRGAVGPAGDALQSRRAQTAASAHGSARHFQEQRGGNIVRYVRHAGRPQEVNGSATRRFPPTRWICPPSSSSAARARSRTPGPCTRRGGMLRSME